jgi:hypothetical protein
LHFCAGAVCKHDAEAEAPSSIRLIDRSAGKPCNAGSRLHRALPAAACR